MGERKHYIALAVRSRIGFNSRLAVFEADEGLKSRTSDYSIIYNEPNISPIIEGPKFLKRGKYFYILAPAGGVGTGWQVMLRSESIYGKYETKIVMMQGDSYVNGPHQGALVDLDDSGERWAFLHFQRKGAWGRVVHLQPAVWRDDWAICGAETYDNLPGNPVFCGDYPVDIATNYKITPTDNFRGDKLSLVWQTPANMKSEWYNLKDGLNLNCVYYGGKSLSLLPQLFMQKIQYLNFNVKTECVFNFKKDGARAGFVVFGKEYRYISAVRRGGEIFIEIKKGSIGGEEDEVLSSYPYAGDKVCFALKAKYEERDKLSCRFILNGKAEGEKFYAAAGVWVGAKLGVFALTDSAEDRTSSAKFKYFKVVAK